MIHWRLISLGSIANDFASNLNKVSGTPISNTGVWVLENSFSIETGGWNLIFNPFSIS